MLVGVAPSQLATGPAYAGPDQGDGGATWQWSRVVATGPGQLGPWRMNRSRWDYVDDPTVALDGRGRTAVAWVDQGRKDVLFQRYGPGGEPLLDGPVNVSRTPGVFSWLPRVAFASEEGERIHLLWQEIVFSGGSHGGEAFFARSGDGGRTFSEPVNLSRTEAGVGKGRLTPERWHNGSLDLAVGPEGAVYAAWTAYEGGLWVRRSDDGGRSFAPARRVNGAKAAPARGPSLAVGPRGTVHLAWAVGGDPAADLRYAVSRDQGRSFSEARVLFPGPRHADAPKLAAGPEGTLHLAFARGPAERERGYAIHYTRRPKGETGFAPPRVVSGEGDGTVVSRHYPSLALDGQGDPRLVWELFHEGRPRSRGLGFTASGDGGRSFAPPTVVPGTDDPAFTLNGSLQGLLMRKLDVNRSGAMAVVNSGFRPREASRVRLIRGRSGSP